MDNDLISRKALLEILRPLNDEPEDMMSDEYFEWDNMCSGDMLNKVLETVEAFPAIDAEPVRHGKWLYVGCGKPDAWDCSECGVMVAKQHFYCPRCGAKMEGRTNDE